MSAPATVSPPRQRTGSHSSNASSNLSDLLSESTDPTLISLREQRLAELRAAAKRAAPAESSIAANAPGHGIPAELAEPIAIQTTASESRALLLFTHPDMAACARMRAHLDKLSKEYPAVACVVVKAEDAAWLAGRMGVKVLPVLVGMVEGKEVGRIVGFEGLEGGLTCRWKEIERWVRIWEVITEEERKEDSSEDDNVGRKVKGSIRDGGVRARDRRKDEEDDSDWD